jgi:hypothetical protein
MNQDMEKGVSWDFSSENEASIQKIQKNPVTLSPFDENPCEPFPTNDFVAQMSSSAPTHLPINDSITQIPSNEPITQISNENLTKSPFTLPEPTSSMPMPPLTISTETELKQLKKGRFSIMDSQEKTMSPKLDELPPQYTTRIYF